MSDDTRREYTITRGTHVRREDGKRVIYQPEGNVAGNPHTILLTDKEAAEVGAHRLNPAPGQGRVTGQYDLEPNKSKNSDSSDSETDWSFTQEETGPNVIKVVQTIDDVDDLADLRVVEEKGKNRKTVLDAIDDREQELSNDEETE